MTEVPFDASDLNRMYRYCVALTGDRTSAYDLLQDGLERYLRSAPSSVRTPMAMLRRILRNRCIDLHRTAHDQQLDSLEALDRQPVDIGFATLENMVIAEQDVERIWNMLDACERELLHLWALEEYTAQEVADLLDQPRGTVLSRIHRLRKRLASWRERDALAENANDQGATI